MVELILYDKTWETNILAILIYLYIILSKKPIMMPSFAGDEFKIQMALEFAAIQSILIY